MTLLSHHSLSNKTNHTKTAAANNHTKTAAAAPFVTGTTPSTACTAATAFPIAQIIPGCLYFTSFDIRLNGFGAVADKNVPKNDAKTVYIDMDSHVHYDAFYDDFGPLNLAVLYRFSQFLHTLVLQHNHNNSSNNNNTHNQQQRKRIFLYTSADPKCRVNAIFLIASYMIIYHHLTAEQAYLRLQCAEPPPFIGFRDAALGPPSYLLHVQHVIKSIEKALKFKWLDFACFDADEYEHFERVENGDLNWIVPDKLLSFCGPHAHSYIENGYPYHAPEVYFDYFREHNVSTIVRLNKKIYDAKKFIDAGFEHHDLFFIDGSTPTEDIVLRFLDIVDSANGAVAVHCKAGLGRTGCMIACWMMKHYRLTAPQCMGWLRVCRPGSVIGPQQQFLIEKQAWCWKLGKADGLWRTNRFNGLESEEEEEEAGIINNSKANQDGGVVVGTNKHTAAMEQETALNEAGQSQGDRLCEIKARAQLRQQHLQQNRHAQPKTNKNNSVPSSPSSSSSSKFVSPPSSSLVVQQHSSNAAAAAMTNDMATMTPSSKKANDTHGRAANCYASATTPIKQLKLSSTVGGGGGGFAPSFVKINSNTESHRRPISPKPFEAQLNNKSMRSMKTTPTTTTNSSHAQRNKNPIAMINRLPIQKVSVSSTGRQHSCQTHSTLSRVQSHRKNFSTNMTDNMNLTLSVASRLKPYQPSECETAHRYATELASTASAQNNYGKSLKKQYNAISMACQQQKRHKQQQNQLMNNNCGKGVSFTSTTSASSPWTASAMDGGGSSKYNENNNHGTNCKYELRPRDQLHLPTRFASEQPSSSSFGPVIAAATNNCTAAENHNNNNSGGGISMPSGGINSSSSSAPYLLARHQKASKSATAFFPTSSRL